MKYNNFTVIPLIPMGNHDRGTTKGVRETDMNSFKPTDIVNTKPKSIEPLIAFSFNDDK